MLSIDKHHTMLYAARRLIELLDFGDGSGFHGPVSGSRLEDIEIRAAD